MTTIADALLSLSAIETAVYDPPQLGHEFDGPGLVCNHCREIAFSNYNAARQPCPSRPVPDPDWQACLFAADLCEDVLQDLALGAWWRWLEREKRIPSYEKDDIWDWWYPHAHESFPDHSRIPMKLFERLVYMKNNQGRYPTRRAAYLDLARVWCEQWRQEHETRKEMAT